MGLFSSLLLCVLVAAAATDHVNVRENYVRVKRNAQEVKRICYYISWSQYRTGDGRYVTGDIDPFLCTHIIFAFAQMNDKTFEVEDFDWKDPEQLAELVALREYQNPDLKIVLAIGGLNAGTDRFKRMTSTQTNRATFIRSLISYMEQHQLDGFDFDWEYPGPSDKDNLSALMKELREAVGSKYLLSIAMGVGEDKLPNYDLEFLHGYLDWFGLMTYDLAGAWDQRIGYHSGLYPSGPNVNPTLNQDWVVNEFLRRTVPADKIILGIPTYGRSFTHGLVGQKPPLQTPATAGTPGEFTAQEGILAYYEICPKVVSGEWKEEHDTSAESALAYGGNQWVGYDSIASTKVKCEYVLDKGLAGTMVWDMSMDDFRDKCNAGANPIMGTIKAVLEDGEVPTPGPTPPPGPTTTTAPAPTTTPPGDCDFECPELNGLFSHPCDKTKYYQCVEGHPNPMDCSTGLCWNDDIKNCDWPSNVPGCPL